MKTDARITAYIDKSQEFAQPILTQIRAWVHEYCPEVEEGWKWSFPHFMLNGKILCSMAAFKQHCSFGFWLGPIMTTVEQGLEGMGDSGKMTSLNDLPTAEQFRAMLNEAVTLTLAGKTIPKAKPNQQELVESQDLLKALKKNNAANAHYAKFPPSHKKEYNLWILDAKTDVTRSKRIEQAVEWISEGKGRNWKYESR